MGQRSFQQQSLRRKIVYTALIVCLFTISLILRQNGGSLTVADKTYALGIESQADALEIRERNLGDVELTGSALRLMTLGSSGLLEVVLWQQAQQMQMKHEWNDLEMIVNSLTKLQPHFITPWLFQSWNLSYNVSVESDRIKDKYFYIARGIQLLSEGERQNRGNPDLRFSMGFYNQHKIGLSDEANTLRCLYEMSCIDPVERDANRLLKQDQSGGRVVDTARFEEFCQKHPMLVRRLRETLKHDSPMEIVAFLDDNQKIPGRYAEPSAQSLEPRTPTKPLEKQFPCLAPLTPEDETNRADPDVTGFDNFMVARDWYTYANKPLPPSEPEYTGVQPPYDVRKYRLPKYMATIIFRGYPARGQSYVAEYLEKEGWFDKEGWKITGGWFPDDKFTSGKSSTVGEGVNWALRAWDKAFNMWQSHGRISGLYLTPEDMKSLNDRADKYRTRYGLTANDRQREPAPEEREEYEPGYKAHGQLFWYERLRAMTNFPHFYYTSQVESDPKTIDARKAFFLADQQRKAGERELALDTYREVLPKWRELLLAHQEFRSDSLVQEDSFEIAIKYLEIVSELYEKPFRQLLILDNYMAQAASPTAGMRTWLPPAFLSRRVPLGFATPLDGEDDEGQPIIGEAAKYRFRDRLGLPPGAERISPSDPLYRVPKAKKRGMQPQQASREVL
jgi:hypothetical protein